MIENFLDWLSALHTKFVYVFSENGATHDVIDWATLVPTLLGGFITLIVALITFWLTARAERKRRDAERNRDAAVDALSGYHKLSAWVDLFGNINNLISDCFKDAHSDGFNASEPFQVVPPFAGRFLEPPALKINEFRFLLTKKYSECVNEIVELEKHGINITKLLDEYSRLRLELESWIDSLPNVERELSGPLAETAIPAEHKAKFEMRVGQLNRILVGLVEQLETDVPRSKKCLIDFVSAANDLFGSDFPKLDIDFIKPKQRVPTLNLGWAYRPKYRHLSATPSLTENT